MNTYRALLERMDGQGVSVGCGAHNLLSAELYFHATCPDGWRVVSVEKVER